MLVSTKIEVRVFDGVRLLCVCVCRPLSLGVFPSFSVFFPDDAGASPSPADGPRRGHVPAELLHKLFSFRFASHSGSQP